MTLAIISDTHGNLAGWQRAWELVLRDADLIVHCGDLLYHGPKFQPAEAYDPQALAEAINACGKPVLVSKGNGDSEVDQLVLDIPIQQPYAFAQIEGTRLLAAHGHLTPPEQLAPLCEQWGVKWLLTGHTHVPSITRHATFTHINPGTPTYPLDPDPTKRRPTCALIEGDDAWLVDLATGDRLPS